MIELFAIVILVTGLIGMGVIIVREIPVLTELSPQEIKGPGIFGRLKDKIKKNGALKTFSGETLLQKILSKIRVLSLKTDNKTSTWLMKLRQKSAKKKSNFSADYWKKINPYTKRETRYGVWVKKKK